MLKERQGVEGFEGLIEYYKFATRVEHTIVAQKLVAEVANSVSEISVPATNVSSVSIHLEKASEPSTLGTYHYLTDEVRLYGPVTNPSYFRNQPNPEQAQRRAILETYVHEAVGHATCPTMEDHNNIYGSNETREAALARTIAAAEQARDTGKYLDGYHANLARQMSRGEIGFDRFVRETHAITMQLRITDPNKLKAVEEAQRSALDRAGKLGEFVKITEGIDETLVALIPNIEDVGQLEQHLDNWRENFKHNSEQKSANKLPLYFTTYQQLQAAA